MTNQELLDHAVEMASIANHIMELYARNKKLNARDTCDVTLECAARLLGGAAVVLPKNDALKTIDSICESTKVSVAKFLDELDKKQATGEK